ncbi:TylF/MycF family methyltransferase [Mumia sp. zg.B53]|uniref:TylF/MycF family methyltransferase n=1 Tax=Mumia sp. zg.B53 TaxID=2855449 RepID=UPI001C6ECE94|nr:TylF/MycF family methyltransferase [Mumia sp. zg.B53]MBW9214131.1 TylF/MycF family methyltransferase [Mumia sp. zg.B53]
MNRLRPTRWLRGASAGTQTEDQLRTRLRQTRRTLRRTERDLAEVRAQLDAARGGLVVPDEVEKVITGVRSEGLSYLSATYLRTLALAVLEAERSGLSGAVVEAGTARGGSAIVMAAAKAPARPMHVYDVFGMIPPPTDADGADVHQRYETIVAGGASGVGGSTYYGYRDGLYEEVRDSFERHGVPVETTSVSLVKGLFADTIDLDEPVVLAHLDGDWYESTMTCLERLAPLIVSGGRIVLDDYYAWSGCRKAVEEYFAGRSGWRREERAKLHLVRE